MYFFTKFKDLLPQAYVTLADIGYPVILLLPRIFELFSCPIFRRWAYLMKIILQDTCRAH